MSGLYTPPKFNMEPEKKSLEKEIPFGNHHFSGSMLNFGGVTRKSKVHLDLLLDAWTKYRKSSPKWWEKMMVIYQCQGIPIRKKCHTKKQQKFKFTQPLRIQTFSKSGIKGSLDS